VSHTLTSDGTPPPLFPSGSQPGIHEPQNFTCAVQRCIRFKVFGPNPVQNHRKCCPHLCHLLSGVHRSAMDTGGACLILPAHSCTGETLGLGVELSERQRTQPVASCHLSYLHFFFLFHINRSGPILLFR
jgi:hypothetical protein